MGAGFSFNEAFADDSVVFATLVSSSISQGLVYSSHPMPAITARALMVTVSTLLMPELCLRFAGGAGDRVANWAASGGRSSGSGSGSGSGLGIGSGSGSVTGSGIGFEIPSPGALAAASNTVLAVSIVTLSCSRSSSNSGSVTASALSTLPGCSEPMPFLPMRSVSAFSSTAIADNRLAVGIFMIGEVSFCSRLFCTSSF